MVSNSFSICWSFFIDWGLCRNNYFKRILWRNFQHKFKLRWNLSILIGFGCKWKMHICWIWLRVATSYATLKTYYRIRSRLFYRNQPRSIWFQVEAAADRTTASWTAAATLPPPGCSTPCPQASPSTALLTWLRKGSVAFIVENLHLTNLL